MGWKVCLSSPNMCMHVHTHAHMHTPVTGDLRDSRVLMEEKISDTSSYAPG